MSLPSNKNQNTPQTANRAGLVFKPIAVMANMPTMLTSVGQNVNVTTDNIVGTRQSVITGTKTGTAISAARSLPTTPPRVVFGSTQVMETRAMMPALTVQSLEGLQSGQQTHVLLKTDGQYQLIRLGTAPVTNIIPQSPIINIPITPIRSETMTNIPSTPLIQTPYFNPSMKTTTTVATAESNSEPQTSRGQSKKPDKLKCRNFLNNLLELSSNEPKSIENNVRNLIQELINAKIEPKLFCNRLENLLKACPQPCLIGFLIKSLPALRQALLTKELVLNGICPPPFDVAFPISSLPVQNTASNNNTMQKQKPSTKQKPETSTTLPMKAKKNIIKKVSNEMLKIDDKSLPTSPNIVMTSTKSVIKENETKILSVPFADDKITDDDDIHDVATICGVNLAEESQRFLESSESIGKQTRSCKDEYLISINIMQERSKAITDRHELRESDIEVANLMNHAVTTYLKNWIEKLTTLAQHRIDPTLKSKDYNITQNVKGQLMFLKDIDEAEKKRQKDAEREILLRAIKLRSKNETPEQAELKAKGKQMQRQELEELRQRDSNLAALQAIGPRKKPKLNPLDQPSTSGESSSINDGNLTRSFRYQVPFPMRQKRVNLRDLLFLMSQERQTAHSIMLYRGYLK